MWDELPLFVWDSLVLVSLFSWGSQVSSERNPSVISLVYIGLAQNFPETQWEKAA